jgi:hypothetical protein
MFTDVILSQQWLDNGQLSRSQDHLQNHSAASVAFKRAKKRGVWRRLRAWLTHRSVQLRQYPTTGMQYSKHVARGVQYIAIDQIIGSEGRSLDFDNQFWPRSEHSRDRWVSIAMAMGTDKPLPPVQLVQTANGYVVRDGNHRVSVARAFGHTIVEAEII